MIDSDEDWQEATQLSGEPEPLPHGETQTFELSSLTPRVRYYIAMKSWDAYGNWSEISNVIEAMVTGIIEDGYTGEIDIGGEVSRESDAAAASH
jgi:hypothetical protein